MATCYIYVIQLEVFHLFAFSLFFLERRSHDILSASTFSAAEIGQRCREDGKNRSPQLAPQHVLMIHVSDWLICDILQYRTGCLNTVVNPSEYAQRVAPAQTFRIAAHDRCFLRPTRDLSATKESLKEKSSRPPILPPASTYELGIDDPDAGQPAQRHF